MSTDPAGLLGLPVCHRELRLGTVSDVLLARWGDSVVAMVISSAWGGASYVLPIDAATIHPDRVDTSPFGLLSNGRAEEYRQRGRTFLHDRQTRGMV